MAVNENKKRGGAEAGLQQKPEHMVYFMTGNMP